MSKKRKKDEKKVTFKESMYYFKRLWSYIRKYKARVFIYIAIMITSFFMAIVYPVFWGKAVVKVVEHDFNAFLLFFGIYLILYLIDSIISIMIGFLASRIYGMVTEDLRNDLYKKIVDLPVEAFDKTKSGEIINRVSESTNTVVDITARLLRVGIRTIRELVLIVIVFFICPEIAMMYLVMIVLMYAIFKKYGAKIKTITKSMRKNSDAYVSNLQQTIQGIREVKSLGLKNNSLLKFKTVIF